MGLAAEPVMYGGTGRQTLREIDPSSEAEIRLVAERMRETLIEVEGLEVGGALYSMEWLEDRVRWHLDPRCTTAQVLLAIDEDERIVGHCIFRIESPDTDPYGLISTTYVLPSVRRHGWASRFLEQAQRWFLARGLSMSCTYTSSTNTPLISLYRKYGYQLVDQGKNDLTDTLMVKLAVRLGPTSR